MDVVGDKHGHDWRWLEINMDMVRDKHGCGWRYTWTWLEREDMR
jgi:hypothetical protein